MLTTLKDIFRPTWKKIGWTLGLGLPVSLFGLLLEHLGVHHSPLLIVWVAIFLLPVLAVLFGFFSSLGSSHPITLAAVAVLQFLYFYVPVCVALFVIRRMRRP